MLARGSQPAVASQGKQLLPHPSPYPTGGAGTGASDCCPMVLTCTQRLRMHSMAGAFALGAAQPWGDPAPPSHLHPFEKSRVRDIRCLHKGWGPTAACPMPDLACWRWASGMARSPLHAGEGALRAGKWVLLCLPAARGCLVQPGSAAGCWAAAAIPPRQGKLAVTHHPCWPCLLGDSSRTLSCGSHQHLHPPQGSGRGPRSCGALGGCWQGRLPAVGDVRWAWGWRDPMPPWQRLHRYQPALLPWLGGARPGTGSGESHPPPLPPSPAPASPCSGSNMHPTPPTGSLHPPAPSQCTGRERRSPFGAVPVPRAVPGAEPSPAQPTPHLAAPGLARVRASQGKDAGSVCLHPGRTESHVTSGCVQVVSLHFGKGTLGRGGQVGMGQQSGGGEATSFGNLPRRFRRG